MHLKLMGKLSWIAPTSLAGRRALRFSWLLAAAACSGDEPAAPDPGQAPVMTGEHAQAAVTSPTPPDPERVGWPGDVAVSLDRGCVDHNCRASALAIDVTSLRRDDVAIELYLAADGLDGRSARIRGDGLRDGCGGRGGYWR